MDTRQVNFAWDYFLIPPFTQLKDVDLKTLLQKEPQIGFMAEAGLLYNPATKMWNLTVKGGQPLIFQFQHLSGDLD